MRLTNKLGFRRKTILDDEFGQLERATSVTKTGSEAVVKQLTPGVGGVLGFGKVKGGSEEEKKADALNDEANKVLETCGADSLFGKALSSLGMTLKRIGEAHANADMSVMDRAILPLKNLLDTTMKQVGTYEKRTDSAADHVASAKKALEKKNDPATQDALRRAEDDFEDAKTQYYNTMSQVLESENDRVSQLRAWVEIQLAFHQQCVDILQPVVGELQSLESQKTSVPQRARTSTGSQNSGGSAIMGRTATGPPPLPPTPGSPQRRCKALYDFYGQTDKELTFAEGEILTVFRDLGPEWLEGQDEQGRVGIFPTNYVQML